MLSMKYLKLNLYIAYIYKGFDLANTSTHSCVGVEDRAFPKLGRFRLTEALPLMSSIAVQMFTKPWQMPWECAAYCVACTILFHGRHFDEPPSPSEPSDQPQLCELPGLHLEEPPSPSQAGIWVCEITYRVSRRGRLFSFCPPGATARKAAISGYQLDTPEAGKEEEADVVLRAASQSR
uniref:Predicted protein n=1 Tax=Physcomitrium patens TaxID=3218 RepID=A9U495_PHYPA